MPNSNLKTIRLALLLLVGSWGAKQAFLSLAVWGAGGALDEAVLDASLSSEFYDETRDLRVEMAQEEADSDPNMEDIYELSEEIDEAREDIYSDKDVIEERVDAEISSKSSASTALSLTQWFLRLKMLLDLVKIGAVVLLIKGSLGLLEDEETDRTTRWFAVGTTVVVLYSILVTGVLSFFA